MKRPTIKDVAAQEINISDFIKRAAVSLSIDTDGLLKSDEQKAADIQQAEAGMQQQAQMQMMGDAVKGAAPQIAKVGAEGIAQQIAAMQQGGGEPPAE